MINGMEDLAFLTGIVMGSILLLAVSWVWISKQVLGPSGITMSLVGVTLVGLTLWSSVSIEASPEGIIAQFERDLEELSNDVEEVGTRVNDVNDDLQNVVSTNIALNRDLETLTSSVTSTSRQFIELTDQLERSNVLSGAPLERVREGIVTPQVQGNDLLQRRQTLEALRSN